MSDMARVLELVAEAENLLSDATDLTPDGYDDRLLWEAIDILHQFQTDGPVEENA